MTGPRSPALGPALVLFAVMAAHAQLETARDALFLGRLGASQLPWAYLLIATLAIASIFAVRRWRGARDARVLLLRLLAVAAAGTAILALALVFAPASVFVLYVWTGLVAALVVPTFWLLVDRQHRPHEAKRRFSSIAAGGSIGALVGAASSAAVGSAVGAGPLVALAALVLAGAAVLTQVTLPPTPGVDAARGAHSRGGKYSVIRAGRYVRLLLLFVTATTIALTLGDLLFKRSLAAHVAATELAAVFGAIYTALNVLALLIQLVVTPRLLDRIGVGGALTVLPVVMLATAVGFAVTGAALLVVALKLGDGALRHSVHRVASEILFLPLPASTRESARHFIEVIGQRGGQALAAVIAVGVTASTGGHGLAVATAVVVVVWLAVLVAVRRGYVSQFRERLDAGDLQRTGTLPALDAESTALLTASLASPEEPEAMAALDLLAQNGGRIPALVLYHPSAVVVRHALSLLHGDARRDVTRVLARLTEHRDPSIRAAALAASSRTGCHHERLVAALEDPEPDVRAAAVISIVTKACGARPLANAKLHAMLDGSTPDRVAIARAIARTPMPQFSGLLVELLGHGEAEVAREVLSIWEDTPELADVDRLLALLDDPRVRAHARRVVTAGGSALLPRLTQALEDPRTPLGVRRHLPRTISRFHTVEAATALVDRLLREPDGTTEFKILRALGRLRANDPALRIATGPLREYARRSIDDAARYTDLAASLVRHAASLHSATTLLLADLLQAKRAEAIERVFRALGILFPRADLRAVHDGITSTDDDRRAAARELLEDIVPHELRAPLLGVLGGRVAVGERRASERELITALLRDRSDSLRCVAAHYVAEQRLVALRSELVRLKPTTASSLVTHAFDQAIARLDA